MTTIILFLFYSYYIFAINYHRKEIKYRIADGYISNKKYKAPLSLKKTVLLVFIVTFVNCILQINVGNSLLILINSPFVCGCLFILKKYERNIKRIDNEMYL